MRLLLLLWLICQYFTCGEKTFEAATLRSKVSVVAASSSTSATYTSTAADVSTPPFTASLKRSSSFVPCEANHCQAVCCNDGCLKGPVALWSMPQACQGCYFVLSQLWWALDGHRRRGLRTWTSAKIPELKRLGMESVDGLERSTKPYNVPSCEKPVSKGPQRAERQGKGQGQVYRDRCSWWRTLVSIIAIPIHSEWPLCSRNYSSSLGLGEVNGSALFESRADPGCAESFPGFCWVASGIEGNPGQDGEHRDEEDHVGPPQVHSGPWKGTQAASGVAGSQVAAQGEVGAALECFVGRLAEADRKFRQTAGAVQYVDPTSDHRIALCSELDSAAQCKSCPGSKFGIPPGGSPSRKSRCCLEVDEEEKKLREKMQEIIGKAAKAAVLPASEVVEVDASPVAKRQRSNEPPQPGGNGADTPMKTGST